VLINTRDSKLRLFIEPSFSIHHNVRHYLKMASHGNLLEVFPTLAFPKKLADLNDFPEHNLKQHIVYGVFRFAGDTVLNQSSQYLIWLSEPLRQVQRYALQFAKNAAEHNQPHDMATILKAGHKNLDNYYTRLISGMDAHFGQCTEAMLNVAIDNLNRHFIFIGINEQQAPSFDRLCALLDWDRSLFPDELPNEFQLDKTKFSDEDLQKIEDLTRYDTRLYEAALTMLQGNKKVS